MRSGLTVLTYHRVLPDERARSAFLPSLVMPLTAFIEQVRFLASRWRVVTAREGVELLARGVGDGPPAVCITFDDGYADNVSVAAPVLEEAGVRATFYITTGLIGTDRRLWFDLAARRWAGLGRDAVCAAAARASGREVASAGGVPALSDWMAFLKALPAQDRSGLLNALPGNATDAPDELDRMMTPDEVKRLHERDHEIGSHSATHPLLLQLSDSELDDELSRSREQIAGWLGEAPAGFCYPNGDHDERVVAAARRAGYGYACTTKTGRNEPGRDRFRLLRIDMNPRRVTRNGVHDELSMRGEISLFHEAVR